ncbi:MAG: peptidoglycan DD-metalloendopeptidase family protein [Clostridia bacterium]|nr:peptidoglycan DD-metalloendopeptidase family protein [Clostridia bacterium]
MRRIVLRAAAFALFAFVICAAFSAALPARDVRAERTIYDVERELNECRSMLASVRNEQAELGNKIDELKTKSGAAQELIAAYTEQIEALEAEIALNSQLKESYDFKRASVNAQKDNAQRDYEYRLQLYKGMMQFIYENCEVTDFELLFTSEGISDYLTRKEDMNELMAAADEIIKRIKQDVSDLEILDSQLAETQKSYEEYLSELAKSELTMEKAVEEYRTIAASLGLDADELREQYTGKNSRIAELTARIKELENERAILYAASSDFGWPLPLGTYYYMSSDYGWRADPFTGLRKFHAGVDLACAGGTPIYASKGGMVSFACTDNWGGGYGYHVVIYHGNGISTLYGHMCRAPSVVTGQTVNKGDIIGYVGHTGSATGDHLHFETRNENVTDAAGRNTENPSKYLPKGFY